MINLSKCELDEYFNIDSDGRIYDEVNTVYEDELYEEGSRRVFYNVPVEEITKSGYFNEDQMLDDEFIVCGGQIEFTVDKDGKQTGEVLLWLSVEILEDGGIENSDFVNFNEDISILVDDFNDRNKDLER